MKSIDCTDKSICWIHLWSSYIRWFLKRWGTNWDFLSAKNSHTYVEKSPSESHSCSCRLNLVELGGILAWLELEEHMFGCLGRSFIRFCCSCASVVFLVWFQVCEWDSYSVRDRIFVGFKNIGVCCIQRCNICVIFVKLLIIVENKTQVILVTWM